MKNKPETDENNKYQRHQNFCAAKETVSIPNIFQGLVFGSK
jgi:hypothetical protein